MYSLEDPPSHDTPLLSDLAAEHQALKETVAGLEQQISRQDSYCKALNKKMRGDEHLFRKQIAALQYKVHCSRRNKPPGAHLLGHRP